MARYLVAGVGIAGAASARALAQRGHEVTVYNKQDGDDLAALRPVVAKTVHGETLGREILDTVDDVVVSPGFPPHHPLVLDAIRGGHDVYSEPELAWRLRGDDAAPWLAVTGTNGKTTTVTMLASILAADGNNTAALGNIGLPLVDAVNEDYDVLAIELSSQQLHWSSQLAPRIGAMLNLADDHLSWHGGYEAYAGAKLAVWRGGVCVGNADDVPVWDALRKARGRRVSFTLAEPGPEQVGFADGCLIDHIGDTAVELCRVEDVHPDGDHNVANAAAASAVARLYGVSTAAVAAGLRGYTPQPHRNVEVGVIDGVRYIDDSKGTNPHATFAAISSYERIVWIAGGQLKGVDIDPLVAQSAPRLSAAVLLGEDRDQIAAALDRHAPDVPVTQISTATPAAMSEVVAAATKLATPGDVVLLSPAAASYDMFSGYPERGRLFAQAVREAQESATVVR